MMRFRAAVLHAPGERLKVEEVELGALEPGDVLVRLRASGLCHTDLEVMLGSLAYPMPIVLGHEGAGVVEKIGKEVKTVKPGDHVILSWNPNCGRCYYCNLDQPILCEPFTRHQPKGLLLDGTSRLRLNKKTLHHYSVTSTHAEYTVVPEAGAIRVPKEIPFDRACLIGCGVMTGVGGAAKIAQVEKGASVAVIGCGAVGLNAVQGARLREAGRVIAIDKEDERLSRSRAFGSTHQIKENPIEQVKALTEGRGADVVLECAGHESGFRLSAEIVRPGGNVVWLGKVNVNQDVPFRWGSLMGEKRFTRSSYGGARPREDFPWLAKLYLEGKLKLDELIDRRIKLEEINEGFDAMRANRVVRAVVTFGA